LNNKQGIPEEIDKSIKNQKLTLLPTKIRRNSKNCSKYLYYYLLFLLLFSEKNVGKSPDFQKKMLYSPLGGY
jgi:hypothetical protein